MTGRETTTTAGRLRGGRRAPVLADRSLRSTLHLHFEGLHPLVSISTSLSDDAANPLVTSQVHNEPLVVVVLSRHPSPRTIQQWMKEAPCLGIIDIVVCTQSVCACLRHRYSHRDPPMPCPWPYPHCIRPAAIRKGVEFLGIAIVRSCEITINPLPVIVRPSAVVAASYSRS